MKPSLKTGVKRMKYMIFWKVKGGDKKEIYKGSDTVEYDGELTKDLAYDLGTGSLGDSFFSPRLYNLCHAVDSLCVAVCENWEILKIVKLTQKTGVKE